MAITPAGSAAVVRAGQPSCVVTQESPPGAVLPHSPPAALLAAQTPVAARWCRAGPALPQQCAPRVLSPKPVLEPCVPGRGAALLVLAPQGTASGCARGGSGWK